MGFIPNAYPVINLGIQVKIGPALSYFNSFENHTMEGMQSLNIYIPRFIKKVRKSSWKTY